MPLLDKEDLDWDTPVNGLCIPVMRPFQANFNLNQDTGPDYLAMLRMSPHSMI